MDDEPDEPEIDRGDECHWCEGKGCDECDWNGFVEPPKRGEVDASS
jgi:hypothetical protein